MIKKSIYNSLKYMSANNGKSVDDMINEALEEYVRKHNHPFANLDFNDNNYIDDYDADWCVMNGYDVYGGEF